MSAAGFFVFSTFTKELTGWTFAFSVSLAALFAALAIAIPQLQQWQESQASRLTVTLESSLTSKRIPIYDIDEYINKEVEAEGVGCLESLRRDSGKRATGEDGVGDAYRMMAQAMRSSLGSFAGRPDERTLEQYEDEVQRYLVRFRTYVSDMLLFQYIRAGLGRLSLTVVNTTDRTIEGVQLEVELPGSVIALDPDDVREPTPPARPREYGKPRPYLDPVLGGVGLNFDTSLISSPRLRSVDIDNSSSARITFHVGIIRPLARKDLGEIHLIVRQAQSISGRWEATATNADGRISGPLMIDVDNAKVSVESLFSQLAEPKKDS